MLTARVPALGREVDLGQSRIEQAAESAADHIGLFFHRQGAESQRLRDHDEDPHQPWVDAGRTGSGAAARAAASAFASVSIWAITWSLVTVPPPATRRPRKRDRDAPSPPQKPPRC